MAEGTNRHGGIAVDRRNDATGAWESIGSLVEKICERALPRAQQGARKVPRKENAGRHSVPLIPRGVVLRFPTPVAAKRKAGNAYAQHKRN